MGKKTLKLGQLFQLQTPTKKYNNNEMRYIDLEASTIIKTSDTNNRTHQNEMRLLDLGVSMFKHFNCSH